jgi:hypothetical protein
VTYVPAQPPGDADSIAQSMYDLVATRSAGWSPDPRALDTAILEANARDAAELRTLVGDVPDLIFEAFGTQILNVPRDAATSAIGTVQFTLSTAITGFTIPAGTQLAVANAAGVLVGFETISDVTTNTTTATTDAQAITAGSDANGVTGTGQMISGLANIDAVTLIVAAAGGVDQESSTGYLDRLVRKLQTYGPHPIVPNDFALLAMDVDGVARALALDGYDAVANTTGNPRVVSLVVQGSDGQPVATGIRTSVDSMIQAEREINFDNRVIDPLYTNIAVVVAVTKIPSADATRVHDDVVAAIAAFLNPATWGGPQLEGDPAWRSDPVVRINDAITAAGRVLGVQTVTSLTLNAGTSNVTMQSGKPHAIPQAVGLGSTVTVTVT